MNATAPKLIGILDMFDLTGDVIDVVRHRAGHINDTFIAATRTGKGIRRYTLQRINSVVFPRPDLIMHNVRVVTEAMRKSAGDTGQAPDLPVLTLVETRQGQSHLRDDDGAYWRCYRYVEGVTYNQVPRDATGAAVAREAAAAFRRFADHLGRLDTRDLHVTIADFHNTPVRLRRLSEAVARDSHKRAGKVSPEIESAFAREVLCGAITEALEGGGIPLRVCHNDTKINNIVFDDTQRENPRALCVIDLDTVMPGSLLFDFGDLVRSSVCGCAEDETELDAIGADIEIFRAIVDGFCTSRGAHVTLTQSERRLLVTACLVITFETGLRFLTDYLMGDVYFRTQRPQHNLDRARNQFRLLEDMEQKRDALEKIVMETAQW